MTDNIKFRRIMKDKNKGEEREENIAPGKNWKLLITYLENLSDTLAFNKSAIKINYNNKTSFY